jgi:hypothetical protein
MEYMHVRQMGPCAPNLPIQDGIKDLEKNLTVLDQTLTSITNLKLRFLIKTKHGIKEKEKEKKKKKEKEKITSRGFDMVISSSTTLFSHKASHIFGLNRICPH